MPFAQMVSPLKLWQHPQPRQLWPVLGSLSVLAHVGVLGLSWPYVLEIMQSESSSAATAPVPIDLVVVDPQENPVEPAVSDTAASTPPQETPRETPDETPNETRDVVSEPQELANSRQTSRQSEINQSANADNQGDRAPNPQQQPDSTKQAETANSPATSANAETANAETANAETAGSGDIGSAGDEPTGEPTGEPTNPSSPLPTVPSNEQSLPSPEEDRAEGNNNPQSALFNIVDFSEAPNQRDVGKTPPKPKDEMISAGIVLDPITKGCPRLAFSQQQWIYRVAVEADGSVRTATVWSGGISRAMSEEERAIACLIENAGFEFEPALFDGEPILDDNLLLTIDIIEVP